MKFCKILLKNLNDLWHVTKSSEINKNGCMEMETLFWFCYFEFLSIDFVHFIEALKFKKILNCFQGK